MVPQIEDPNAEPEPEEMKGEFWVVFVCSLSAPKQVNFTVYLFQTIIGEYRLLDLLQFIYQKTKTLLVHLKYPSITSY